MLLAEVADQASQAAPLPAGDRLRMAARGRTVGAEASSYQALGVPEDRAQGYCSFLDFCVFVVFHV